ncbi:hypothetical protein Ngar_c16400 [Candidatus Nitrososphaera gargensis Ga9.2]|uniref:Uncharacterized protein n=1 Tax=Nitrososphaera gargensis (strain Ga9.2) TaxID=1237085 RepID=K0II12_NITGG|nr:hypothetical protein Ngar_c16400 [Candidatus Nitrososphaera gargensis Ga9.2]
MTPEQQIFSKEKQTSLLAKGFRDGYVAFGLGVAGMDTLSGESA